MEHIAGFFDVARRRVLEPAFDWVLDHPIVSLLVVIGLIYWSVRGYRML